MNAREIMAVKFGQPTTDRFLAALTAAGYRILAPGEIDKETAEKCAKIAEGSWLPPSMSVNTTWGEASNTRALGIARALRSIGEE